MDATSLLIFLVIGAIAGWLAGLVMKRGGFGIFGNSIVGMIGAFVGGFAFGLLGLSAGGVVGSLVMAIAGAVILIFLLSLIEK